MNKLKMNRKKLNAAVLTLLILLSFGLITAASAIVEQLEEKQSGDGNMFDAPGVPDNTVQYNKTDVTPVAEMEQVRAGEPALFRYRNTTILMNCSENCDLVVTIDPEVKPRLFGIVLEHNQTMTITMNLSGSPLEGEEVMERTLNFFWGIEPNATLQLRGQLRLYINQTELSQELNREVNGSTLTWMYWNRTQTRWEEVPSYIDQDGYLVCNTDHFSIWTIAEMAASDSTEGTQNGFSTIYWYIIIVVVVVISMGIGVVVIKRR